MIDRIFQVPHGVVYRATAMTIFDATLINVSNERGCISLIKKPVFIYADFDRIPNKCLIYIVDSSQCWSQGLFDSKKATIPKQLPRTVSPQKVLDMFSIDNETSEPKTGVYHSRPTVFYALKAPCNFFIMSDNHNSDKLTGAKGDWIVSDGKSNALYSEAELKKKFALNKDFDFSITLCAPAWDTSIKGGAAQEYKTMDYGK